MLCCVDQASLTLYYTHQQQHTLLLPTITIFRFLTKDPLLRMLLTWGHMTYCWRFLFILPRLLRAPSADHNETLPHDRKYFQFYNPGRRIQGLPPPKKRNFGGQKHAKFREISDNFRCRSQISPEQTEISKIEKKIVCNSSHVQPIKCGEVWSSKNKDHQSNIDWSKISFSQDHISAPSGWWSLKFLYVPENGQGLLAHTPLGMRDHPNNF